MRSALNGTPQYHYLLLFFLSKGENSFANDLNTPYCCAIKTSSSFWFPLYRITFSVSELQPVLIYGAHQSVREALSFSISAIRPSIIRSQFAFLNWKNLLSVCQQSSNTKRSHHRFALHETHLPTFQVYTKAFANVDFGTEQQPDQRSNLIARTHSTLQIVCCRLLPPLFKSEPVYNLLIAAHTSELDPRLLNHSASRGVRHLIRIADYYVRLPSASSEHTYFHRP